MKEGGLKIQKAPWGRLTCSLGLKTGDKQHKTTSLGVAQFVLFSHFGCVASQQVWILIDFTTSALCSAGRPVCWLRCSEHFLGGVGDVEEAVSITVAGVNLAHAWGHAGHALLRHQEKESLAGVQSNLVPKIKEGKKKTVRDVNKLWKTTDIYYFCKTKEWDSMRCEKLGENNGKFDSLGEKVDTNTKEN